MIGDPFKNISSALLKFVLVLMIAYAAAITAVHFHADGVTHENCLVCVFSVSNNSDGTPGITHSAQVNVDTTDVIIYSAVPVTANLLFCLWPHAPPLS